MRDYLGDSLKKVLQLDNFEKTDWLTTYIVYVPWVIPRDGIVGTCTIFLKNYIFLPFRIRGVITTTCIKINKPNNFTMHNSQGLTI